MKKFFNYLENNQKAKAIFELVILIIAMVFVIGITFLFKYIDIKFFWWASYN